MSTYQRRRSTWADLAPELLELILQRLTLMDYLKCREICSSWQKAVNDAIAAKGRCPPLSQLPFLLIISRGNPAMLMSLTQHRVLTMSTQSWVGLINKVQSVHGWLMFNRLRYVSVKDQTFCELSFFNPVSRARFTLPALSLFPGRETTYQFNRIAFASTPDSPEFLVALLFSFVYGNRLKQQLAFCKVTQELWTFIETAETAGTYDFNDIAVHDGKLYATTFHARDYVIVFSLRDANAITVERLAMLDPKPIPMLDHFDFNPTIRRDMLAMDTIRGELLLVSHLSDGVMNTDSGKYSFWTKGFRVFKLDPNGPRWSEIKHLGDRFLFLDRTGIKVVSAGDLDGAEEFNGGNCIFFCMADTLYVDQFSKYELGVFFLADRSIKHFSASSSLPVPSRAFSSWFSPNAW